MGDGRGSSALEGEWGGQGHQCWGGSEGEKCQGWEDEAFLSLCLLLSPPGPGSSCHIPGHVQTTLTNLLGPVLRLCPAGQTRPVNLVRGPHSEEDHQAREGQQQAVGNLRAGGHDSHLG